MDDIVYKLEEKEFRFRPIKGRKLVKFSAFMAQIAGGDIIKLIKQGKIDSEISPESIGAMIGNLTDKNIDRLLDEYFRKFVVVPNLSDDTKAEEFFDGLEMQEIMQLLISFVMMGFTGSFPDVKEIQKKLSLKEKGSRSSLSQSTTPKKRRST